MPRLPVSPQVAVSCRRAHFRWLDDRLRLYCHIHPGASRNTIVGVHGDRLKIQITSPPIEGRANAGLIQFISTEFGVAKSAVSVERGPHGRHKVLVIRAPRVFPAAADIAPSPLC